MNWADYTILAVLALSVLMGLWRGFIGEVLALVCWVLAFWVAWMFGPALAEQFSASISTPSVRVLLAYALCFVTVLIAGAIVAFLMRKLVEGSGLVGQRPVARHGVRPRARVRAGHAGRAADGVHAVSARSVVE